MAVTFWRCAWPIAELERAAALLAHFSQGGLQVDPDLKKVSLHVTGRANVLVAAGRELDDHGIVLDDLGVRRPTLDDVFLSFTGHPAVVEEVGHDGNVGREVSS